MDYLRTLSVLISFTAMPALIYGTKGYWLAHFKKIKPRQLIILILILLSGAWLRFILFRPRHIMYVDEFWYMKAAKDLLLYKNANWYPKSIGWPFVLSIVFLIFGISNLSAIYTSILIGVLTSLNIFLIGSYIFKNEKYGLFAAAIFSIIPSHILWSVTAETNVFSLYFVTLSIYFSLLYYEHKSTLLLWATLVIIGFTAHCRPENYILYPLLLGGILIFIRPLPKLKLSFLLPWIVSFSLSLSDLLVVLNDKSSTNWLMKESGGTIVGSNFSIQNLIHNSSSWGLLLFSNSIHSFLFSIAFIFGFFYCLKFFRKYALFLAGWFVLIYLIYFSAWFQTLGGGTVLWAKKRFYLSFYPIMTIYVVGALYAVEKLAKNKKYALYVQLLLAIVIGISFLFYMGSPKDSFKELELKTIPSLKQVLLPTDIVLTNLPEVLTATTEIKAFPLKNFLRNKSWRDSLLSSGNKVFFFEDYTCSILSFGKDCEAIKNNYALIPFCEFSLDKYQIKLYQVYGIKK